MFLCVNLSNKMSQSEDNRAAFGLDPSHTFHSENQLKFFRNMTRKERRYLANHIYGGVEGANYLEHMRNQIAYAVNAFAESKRKVEKSIYQKAMKMFE